MVDTVVLTERLAEAELAYHRLMTGGAVVELRDQNGEVIKYTQASATRLASYIQYLKEQLGLLPRSSKGPMKVWF